MATNERKGRLQKVKRAVKRASAGGGRIHGVNIARRANIVIAKNVGEDGSFHGAVAKQTARIRQDGHETLEESEKIEGTF